METFRITANGRSFQQAVKFLKKQGGTFNAGQKTWSVPADTIGDSDCKLFGLQRVAMSPAIKDSEAEMYRDWSNNPESIY